MDEVYTWIRNIVIYMILNTIIMNLLGDKSYKKYISIVSGMILVLIVISPILKLTNIEDNLDYFLQSNEYSLEASEFKNDLNRMDEAQSEAIFAEYENKLREQVKEQLKEESLTVTDFDVTIDKNTKSTTFGELLQIDIKATTEQTSAQDNGRALDIEAIEIDRISMGKKEQEQEQKQKERPPSPLEILVKNKLSDFYNIEQGNINITIQGG